MSSSRLRAAFAIDALLLLEKGEANDAAMLCVSGLGMYPDYLGGYVLLSRAYDALDRPLDANIIRDEAQRRFPCYVRASAIEVFDIPLSELQSTPPERQSAPSEVKPAPPEVLQPEPPRAAPPVTTSPLRIIDTAQITDDTRIIRSASIRLIPGLEFTTLRFEGTKSRGRREIQTLADPPPFRRFHPARRVLQPVAQHAQASTTASPSKSQSKPLSLEELASRLERARMPRSGEATQPLSLPAQPSHPVVPTSANMGLPRQQSLVTETIARIYMQQGAYEKAIDAFSALAIQKPEKSAEYQTIIAELTSKLNS